MIDLILNPPSAHAAHMNGFRNINPPQSGVFAAVAWRLVRDRVGFAAQNVLCAVQSRIHYIGAVAKQVMFFDNIVSSRSHVQHDEIYRRYRFSEVQHSEELKYEGVKGKN